MEIAEGLGMPGREDEERTTGAGIEARLLGLVKGWQRLLLDVYQGVALGDAAILDEELAGRDAWGDQHGGASEDLRLPAAAIVAEGLCVDILLPSIGRAAMPVIKSFG